MGSRVHDRIDTCSSSDTKSDDLNFCHYLLFLNIAFTDFSPPVDTSIKISPSNTRPCTTIVILNDNTVESNERLRVSVTFLGFEDIETTVVILDDDSNNSSCSIIIS